MHSRTDPNLRLRRLRWLLGLLFLGLAVPAALLIRQGFIQIELAEFRRQQLIAEELVRGIDARLALAIDVENARPITDFQYAATTSDVGNVVQLSPLSSLAVAGSLPGTVGYFQVDTTGQLSTPLLPGTSPDTVADADFAAKMVVFEELSDVLEANRLVNADADRSDSAQPVDDAPTAASSELLRGQEAFDELAVRGARARPAVGNAEQAAAPAEAELPEARSFVRVSAFAGDVEPLRFGLLETGHFVLFRNAWRDGERLVQGLLIDRASFVADSVEPAFFNAGLADGTELIVSAADNRIASISAGSGIAEQRVDGSSLYAARLSPPMAEVEIALSAGVLERGPGFNVLVWTTVVLFGVLVGGFAAMYRFGVQQMQLARQQQNFVSAVSHELKTPLTSIRMYGEMLRSGWADDEKKQVYYDYIFDEGERLSRLIDNVLQLARLSQSGPAIAAEEIAVSELLDVIRSKLSTQAERSGFGIDIDIDPAVKSAVISADVDALTQVFINLVDNAIKFSGEAGTKRIVVTARGWDRGRVVLGVRDFGPGIPPEAMKRLFELFYRPDNELTRTTAGTGIGLALVKQLVTAMGGRIDVKNSNPGAEFRLVFPRADH